MLAFVISDMLGQKAGCYLATSLLCQELARLDLRVTCFAQNVAFGGDPIPITFEVVRPWVRRGCRWDWPGRCLTWQAKRQIRAQDPDYVIVMGTGQLARYLLSSNVANRLLVWELTNATHGNKYVDAEASRLLNRCRAMLSPSAAIDRGIRETYGYRGPVLRLPFWVEETGQSAERRAQSGEVRGQPGEVGTDFTGQGKQKEETPSPLSYLLSPRPASADFIYLGRRDVEKGLHELVRATAAVAKEFPGVRVLVTGQGSEAPFATTARELGVAENIRFQFFSTREETLAALANSRCLVLPSYHEGYPLVLLEAARCGVPSIATTVGSIPEIFADSPAAVLVPPKDVPALTEAMRTILAEPPQQHEQRRTAARELFRKLNSAEAITARLQDLLQQLAGL